MKLAHSITIRVFCHEGEDSRQIEASLRSLLPFDLEQEKLELQRSVATGFKEKKIKILEIRLEREKHTTAFLEALMAKLSESQRELLLRQAESRLDGELNFYIRLDKPKMLAGQCWITDSGNCFHIKISLAAFPATREAALGLLRCLFGELTKSL